jgi:serine phosphatase RsbU (regulator of sigma subunit)
MAGRLLAIAKRFWPELDTMSERERADGVAEVVGLLYSAPLALAGLVWLIAVTDPALIRAVWPTLLLLLTLLFVFERFDFFFFVELTPGTYIGWGESLWSAVTWSAALIFGPSGLWLFVLWKSIGSVRGWRRSPSTASHWQLIRNLAFNLVRVVLAGLIALTLYERWGGVFPLPGLTPQGVLPTFCATFIWWLLSLLIWLPYLISLFNAWALTGSSLRTYVRFWAIGIGWHVLATPFAVLAAGLYAQNGLGWYLFLVAGVLVASLLAHQMSHAVERSQLRSRELEELERLGRAILKAPPDASTLPDVLREHVSNMFPRSQMEIRADYGSLFPEQTLLRHPADGPPVGASVWDWLRTTSEPRCFLPGEALPWEEQPASDAVVVAPTGVVVAPILDFETAEPIGGIHLSRRWRPDAVDSLLPAVQSLAAQISSALDSARVYAQTLAHQRVEQELALAWQIQVSFLPHDLPHIPGWQLVATLKPAREVSGDFYDVISLPNGRFGILVADVSGKGMGAALYMALSRTLLRTYAIQYQARPDHVFSVANRRILMDTDAKMFVTVFYGILDPITGTLTYCNAGHNPPCLLNSQNESPVQELRRTGIPLGVFQGETWEHGVVQFAPGDVLVLYTDGVTDAQDEHETFFGEERLCETAQANLGRPAQDVQDGLIAAVQEFVGDAPQFDDITVMVVARGSPEEQGGK